MTLPKQLVARRAVRECLFAGVATHVFAQSVRARKLLTTLAAAVRTLTRVRPRVTYPQMALLQLLVAEFTDERADMHRRWFPLVLPLTRRRRLRFSERTVHRLRGAGQKRQTTDVTTCYDLALINC